MFPQLFQRFLAARDARAIKTAALLYPLVTGVLFFLPVAIGLLGRLALPGLEGQAADSVLPRLAAQTLPPWAGAVALVAVLAALMSTMDSQLLTLSSMIGNAYADEVLFEARLHPKTLVAHLSADEVVLLYEAVRSVMDWGIRAVRDAGEPMHVKVRGHLKVRKRG